ncbi:hypothetical protein OROGR_007120 [Orobanche gracilis]
MTPRAFEALVLPTALARLCLLHPRTLHLSQRVGYGHCSVQVLRHITSLDLQLDPILQAFYEQEIGLFLGVIGQLQESFGKFLDVISDRTLLLQMSQLGSFFQVSGSRIKFQICARDLSPTCDTRPSTAGICLASHEEEKLTASRVGVPVNIVQGLSYLGNSKFVNIVGLL